MSYTTDLGSNPLIIDDSNAHEFVQQARDEHYGTGYVARPYDTRPQGYYAPAFRGEIFPRSKWDDLIKMQEDNQSSPWHVFQANGAPILDQNGFGYCWMYGVVACLMNRYMAQGLNIPKLSATYTAYLGKNGRNEGGWGGEAIKYIEKYGVPTQDVFPECCTEAEYFRREEVKRSAAMHKHAKFLELPRRNFDAMCSQLLHPKKPRPVTMALGWWGHLVAGYRVVKTERGYGIQGPNSWKVTWGDRGCFVLAESKATADESIAIEEVTARVA